MLDKENIEKTNAWPFVEAKKILRERKKNIDKKGKIILQTGYGPSGLPHIGTFGEVARTSMVVNALNHLTDLPKEIITFSDDMDGLRKIPDNVPNKDILNKNLNISIDCGNGAAGVIAKDVYERLGCNVIELYGELDGSFPNHHPDPSKLENMEDLIKSVKENKSSVGLAFDGDADRLGVISPIGEMIFPDRQMIMFSRQVIQSSPNAKIVFDVKCSKLLSDEIKKLKGKPLMCKTGHTFIKQKIRETDALLLSLIHI